ncbi:hypothetical protein KAR91_14075, partial [Candidatus Pacearchaeota archaeon]|nr:hypothetical protein [Candidatus Pacearchaeota archaeon]
LIYSARGHLHKHIQRDPIKHALEDAVNKAIELWDEYDKTTLHTDMVNDLYPIIIKDHNLMEEYNVNINDEKAKMAFINSFKTSLRKALAPHAKKRGLRKGDKGVKKIEKD